MKWPEVRKLLQISTVTLSKYVKQWRIRVTQKFEWSRYDYNDEDVYNMIWKKVRKSVIYSRNYHDEIELIQKFMLKNWVKVWEIYKDNWSWLDFNRKNFIELIKKVQDNEIKEVYVTYKDRLSRIWFDMFEILFKNHWCRIIVLNDVEKYESEVLWEVSSLLKWFSKKMKDERIWEKLELISKDLKNYDISWETDSQ